VDQNTQVPLLMSASSRTPSRARPGDVRLTRLVRREVRGPIWAVHSVWPGASRQRALCSHPA